jgi:L-seryl-tRNA(Ser) seleniumtransferase
MSQSNLRALPSVDQLLQTHQAAELIAHHGRPLTLQAIRAALDAYREKLRKEETAPQQEAIFSLAQAYLHQWVAATLEPVINATGVILHTNLGRAPLSQAALRAINNAAAGYSTLEYDLKDGKRGSRLVHATSLLTRITGAEDALVVNNNAGAVLLALSALAYRRQVIVPRSQLVEIGGGFRIPDVMRQSGAKLIEIGATNRVYLSDYKESLNEKTGIVLHTHASNFRIIGFTNAPPLTDIVGLAHQSEIPLLYDLGSGALLDTTRFGLAHEPTVNEGLAAGADLVCFSGDKLLGGPQAGIIVGKADLLAKIKKHPLARALRADKLCLAGLTATLIHYLKDEAEREIPVWQMISRTPEQLHARVKHWADVLGVGEIIEGQSTIGGGSMPDETLPTFLLSLDTRSPDNVLKRLRAARPPIIARIENNRVVLDARTVLPDQEGALLVGLQNISGH